MTAADIVVLILGAMTLAGITLAIRENHIRVHCEDTISGLRDRLKQCTSQRALDQDRIARCEAMIESQQIRIFELKETIEQLQESK